MMKKSSGDPGSPLWLIGDSEPERWRKVLSEPLDARHPARHNIWTPIAYQMQESLFNTSGKRLDLNNIFIRNAVTDAALRPARNEIDWTALASQLQSTSEAIAKFKPDTILTFGAFAYEFVRRALDLGAHHKTNYWGTERLGNAFRDSIASNATPLVLPLLHVSIARGSFLRAHCLFTACHDGNYFAYVGKALTELILSRPRLQMLLRSSPKDMGQHST